MYTVCASAVISPLRQWLDSYAKTRLKMCHTFKHLFICNTFCCRLILLSLSLYIELALMCCTNHNNINCFGTIFPNLNLFLRQSEPPARSYWIRPIQNNCQTRTRCRCYSIHPDWGATKTALWLWVRKITWYLYNHRSARANEGKTTLIWSYSRTVSWMVSSFSASCSWRPLDWRIRQSFGVYTVSQSRSVVASAENPAPDNSPQSIGELRNGHVANLQELYHTRLVKKMAWYKILIHVLIV